MKGFGYLSNVATLKLDSETCNGCGRCLEVCPHQVFSIMGNKAQIIGFNACMECGACAKNCPTTAVHVEAGVGCATGLINEWLMEKNLIKSRKECCY